MVVDRYQPRNRRHSRKLLFGNGDPGPFYQGLEQMYGIALRDPTAYRPFVEFCLSLPTKMFIRDGEMRWLAKQMAKGIMPEEQRRNALDGWWDADGQLRIRRRRSEWLAELARMEDEIRRDPSSPVANYWLPVSARGVGDLDRAWDEATAGWVRSTLSSETSFAVREDLDRFVAQVLVVERSRARSGFEQPEAARAMQEQWQQLKQQWK